MRSPLFFGGGRTTMHVGVGKKICECNSLIDPSKPSILVKERWARFTICFVTARSTWILCRYKVVSYKYTYTYIYIYMHIYLYVYLCILMYIYIYVRVQHNLLCEPWWNYIICNVCLYVPLNFDDWLEKKRLRETTTRRRGMKFWPRSAWCCCLWDPRGLQ